MARYEYTETEWRILKVDLVTQLALKGIYRPKSLQIAELRTWFAEADFDIVPALVAGLVADDDCPLAYAGSDDAVWLTDPDATVAYLDSRGPGPP